MQLRILLIMILFGLTTAKIESAYANQAREFTLLQKVKSSDLVVVGRAVDVRTDTRGYGGKVITVEIKKTLKG